MAVDIEKLLEDEHARHSPARKFGPLSATEHTFEANGEDSYRMVIPLWSMTLEVTRLRRERQNLVGELTVYCGLPGARAVDGIISAGDFNFSSVEMRWRRAKILDTNACTRGAIDWSTVLEELCLRIIQADRAGQPAVMMGKPKPEYRRDLMYNIDGLMLLQKHPTIIFGGPETNKSYIALRALGKLAEQGKNVMYVDWELGLDDHEFRLSELFPDGAPPVEYMRSYRPLTEEVERIQQAVRDNKIDYIAFDSAGFGCGGAPESAETTLAYFRAVRKIGVGSLHIAHNPKPDPNGKPNDQEPFGSRFWKANARLMWYVAADESTTNPRLVAMYCRKANLDRRPSPVAYRFHWTDYGTCVFSRTSIMESQELSEGMSVRERIYQVLTQGRKSVTQIADELQLDTNTVTQTINRYVRKGKVFIVLEGENTGRVIGLLGRDKAS